MDKLLGIPAANRRKLPCRGSRRQCCPVAKKADKPPTRAPNQRYEPHEQSWNRVKRLCCDRAATQASENSTRERIKNPVKPFAPEPVLPENPQPQPDPAGQPADPVLSKRLDTYFARLRELYPDGEIRRLNTGHKKLAERGAALRRETGYEDDTDGFFALGGFRYCRESGGRPVRELTPEDFLGRLSELFPKGIPPARQIQQADHQLYLDLRAAARRENKPVGKLLMELSVFEENK
ncbi:MAG: hypothetical protein FWE80_00390 [Oscillospiraceae bacterium]|nr:hypothetical protein [Oscillospiraceae bacterium]